MTGSPVADPTAVAGSFNDCINARDVDGLAGLMTDDHTFVDTGGGVVAGKQECLAAWRGFFESFPDYRNVFTSLTTRGDVVAIAGHSECSEPALAGPALWTAEVRGGAVVAWRVYEDSPEARQRLGVPESRSGTRRLRGNPLSTE
jgi:ketosteroid isomerase-like protein